MKVTDLIANSIFTPGASRDSATPPQLTVILPTFRRGDSGLLQRTLDSLLSQSFDHLELIVVDDASTDSSAQIIADTMRRDPRVSVIRHERNIGLPAVSEYEAYRLARGTLISFAFDDTVFHPGALARLVDESEQHPDTLIVGRVTAFYIAGDGSTHSWVLGDGAQESDLLTGNTIANSAVLAPASLLDRVGLFDPHISLARLCDYDLWLRVRRRFPLRFVDVSVGEEHGPTQGDSLGLTYPLDPWVSDDRMRQRRDELLTPDRFDEIDVFDAAGFESARSHRILTSLVDRHLETHAWMTRPAPPPVVGRVPRIMVLASPVDASVQLVFEGLRDAPGLHVRMMDPAFRSLTDLTEVDVLVVSRSLRATARWVDAASAIGIPVYYYLDVNLPLLSANDALEAGSRDEFAISALREDASRVRGVLTATEALAASLREQRLHPHITAVDLAAPRVVADWHADPAPAHHIPTIALYASDGRVRDLPRTIWPAVVELNTSVGSRMRLVVPETAIDLIDTLPGRDEVDVVPLPASTDYFVELRRLRDLSVDVLLVPDAGTVGAKYETQHPVMAAAVLGAALVTTASPANADLGGTDGVTLVAARAGSAEWTAALRSGMTGRPVGSGLLTARFDPRVAANALLAALDLLEPVRDVDEPARLRRLADWLALQQPQGETGGGAVALAGQLHTAVRRARWLHVMRPGRRHLPGYRYDALLDQIEGATSTEHVELSTPLTGIPFLGYTVRLAPGRYRDITAMIWADGVAGDVLGVEIVDPHGQIRFRSVTSLPRANEPVSVTFDARHLEVDEDAPHEVRIFVRSGQLAFVLERVDRGILGLRRTRVTPMMEFRR